MRLHDQCIESTALNAGHLTCVKLLLSEGADIDQRNVVRTHLLILRQQAFFTISFAVSSYIMAF